MFQKTALRAVLLATSLSVGGCGDTLTEKHPAAPPSEELARTGAALAVSSLQDNFNDGSLSSSLWTLDFALGGTVTESNGTLNFAPDANTDGVGLSVTSTSTYSLTGSSLFIEVPQVVSMGGYVDQQLRLRLDSGNMLIFHAQSGNLSLVRVQGGTRTTLASPAYSATSMRWWRFRESSGTVYWETSADGSTWTQRASVATSGLFSLSALKVHFFVETYGGGTASPGVARFDNLNVAPTPTDPGTGTGCSTSSTATDVFGVKQLCPSKPGGEAWHLSSNPTSDSRFDPQATLTANGDGSWKIQDTSVRMRVETSTGYDASSLVTNRETLRTRGYMQAANDWRNVEMTGFVKINATSTTTENLSWYTRGGRHNDDTLAEQCEGSAYHGNLTYDGRVRWEKESWHVDYDQKPYLTATSTSLVGRWVGFKALIRNVTVNGQTAVKLELYLNNNADKVTWVKVYDATDAGDWGGDSSHCGALAANDAMPLTWGGPLAFFRWDGATDADFKWLSIREIQ